MCYNVFNSSEIITEYIVRLECDSVYNIVMHRRVPASDERMKRR